jgi:putative transposase
MVRLGLKVRYPKRFKVTTDSNHSEAISPNSLDRQFDVVAPNQVWTTDITYIWTLEGWLYLAVVIDLFSRQVVGWAIADPMRTELCACALQMAFWRRKPKPGLLHHSDRGSQYASHDYRKQLAIMKMEQGMSRKGNCWDNSPTERFFRSLKHEQLNYERFRTKESAKLSIVDYLAFYNSKRAHSKLGYQSPLQFERDFYRKAV